MRSSNFVCLAFLILTANAAASAARLFTSGFETNNTTATEWTAVTGSPTIQSTTKHSGTYAESSPDDSTSNFMRRDLTAAVTSGTYYLRFYVYFSGLSGTYTNLTFAELQSSSGVVDVDIDMTRSGSTANLSIQIDSGNVYTGTYGFAAATWYRIDCEVILSTTAGFFGCKVYDDSSNLLDTIASTSSENTLPASNAQRWAFGHIYTGNTFGGAILYDDIAINDTSGSLQNSGYPIGAGNVVMVKPGSDNGTPGWTSTGTCTGGHYACVNDEPGTPNDTNYEGTSTSSKTDRFNDTASGITTGSTLILIDLYGRYGSTGTSNNTTFQFSVWDNASGQTLGSTITPNINGWRITPTNLHVVVSLSGKTVSQLDSFSMGMASVTGSTRPANVSALWANVEYQPPAGASPFLPGLLLRGVGQ